MDQMQSQLSATQYTNTIPDYRLEHAPLTQGASPTIALVFLSFILSCEAHATQLVKKGKLEHLSGAQWLFLAGCSR